MNVEMLSSQILGKEPSIWLRSSRISYSSVVRAFQQVFWKVMGSTPVGELGKSFSEYLTWEHFYIYFHFIQVTISLIIKTKLSPCFRDPARELSDRSSGHLCISSSQTTPHLFLYNLWLIMTKIQNLIKMKPATTIISWVRRDGSLSRATSSVSSANLSAFDVIRTKALETVGDDVVTVMGDKENCPCQHSNSEAKSLSPAPSRRTRT